MLIKSARCFSSSLTLFGNVAEDGYHGGVVALGSVSGVRLRLMGICLLPRVLKNASLSLNGSELLKNLDKRFFGPDIPHFLIYQLKDVLPLQSCSLLCWPTGNSHGGWVKHLNSAVRRDERDAIVNGI